MIAELRPPCGLTGEPYTPCGVCYKFVGPKFRSCWWNYTWTTSASAFCPWSITFVFLIWATMLLLSLKVASILAVLGHVQKLVQIVISGHPLPWLIFPLPKAFNYCVTEHSDDFDAPLAVVWQGMRQVRPDSEQKFELDVAIRYDFSKRKNQFLEKSTLQHLKFSELAPISIEVAFWSSFKDKFRDPL